MTIDAAMPYMPPMPPTQDAPPSPGPDRPSRRRRLILLTLFLAVTVGAIVLLAVWGLGADASAAGGCGGG